MAEAKKAAVTVSEAAQLTVKNTLITQSGGYGLFLREGSLLPAFGTNTFSHNNEAPVLLAASHVSKLDAASAFMSGNGRNGIEVMQSEISGTGEAVWPAFNDNTAYRFVGLVTAQTGWKLSPGVTIEIAADQYIDIEEGYLNAVGTPAKKISFVGESKTPGSWRGIILHSGSSSNRMEQVHIQNAGGEELLSRVKSSIALASVGKLSIKNSSITHSGGYGIHVYGAETSLNPDAGTSNTFTANAQGPVFYNR